MCRSAIFIAVIAAGHPLVVGFDPDGARGGLTRVGKIF